VSRRFGLLSVALVAVVGCRSQPPPPVATPAPTTSQAAVERWRVATVAGKPVDPALAHIVVFDFAARTVSANGPCNAFSAGFSMQGAELLIGAGAMTQMGCDPPREAADVALVNALTNARRIEHDGAFMVLKDAAGRDLAGFARVAQ
jgi:heat shock protein HslJ